MDILSFSLPSLSLGLSLAGGSQRAWSPGSLGQPHGGTGQGREGKWMWGQGKCQLRGKDRSQHGVGE